MAQRPGVPGRLGASRIEAVRRDLSRQREAWGEARYEPVEIIRLGEKIVVLVDVQVTGRASGAPVSLEGAHVLTPPRRQGHEGAGVHGPGTGASRGAR